MFAAPRDNSVPPQLNHWLRDPSGNVFDRLYRPGVAGLQSLHSFSSHPRSNDLQSIRSGSSMTRALLHQSAVSVPSLYSSTINTDTSTVEESVCTGAASQLAGFALLEEGADGVLELPVLEASRPSYECLFWFLNCGYLSQDNEEWQAHCLSHFHGEDPPRSVICPLCEWKISCDDGTEAWSLKMQHVAEHHFKYGHKLNTSRPDFHLFTYLWQLRLIDDQDLKELKGGNHNLTHTPANFVTTHRRGPRHAHGHDRQRLQHVVRPGRS